MVSLYTTKPGGLFKAKKMAAVAEAAGLGCNVNGSVETGIGNAANLHLAASTAVASLAAVIPVSRPKGRNQKNIAGIYYQDDIIKEPFAYASGEILVPTGPGLGVELDEDKLKRYRADA
jgi:muconate cycloisomerase